MKVYPETVKKICCYNKPRGKKVKDEPIALKILRRIRHVFRRYSIRKYAKEGENDWQEE